MNVFFSFILPAFKGKYLRDAIDSIVAQSYSNWELVVVDDCSPDDLRAIVDSFDDNRIRYYRNEKNIGGLNLVEQWNNSIKYATGDFIILASDDDLYEPDYLCEIDRAINLYPSSVVFRPRIRQIHENGHIIKEEDWEFDNTKHISCVEFIEHFSKEKILSGIPQYAFNRSALLSEGGFVDLPLAWFSDDATIIKMSLLKGIVLINRTLFSFRVWDCSITGSKPNVDTARKKITAASKFVKFISSLPLQSPADGLIERARLQSIYQIDCHSLKFLLSGLRFMSKSDPSLFPLSWRLRKLLGYIRRKFNSK